MNRSPVTSSNLESIGYDPDSQTLEIEFKDGHVYQYFDVQPSMYQALMAATAHGKFFAAEVRGRYRYARVS